MDVNEFLLETRKYYTLPDGTHFLEIRPRVFCADGFNLSIQASDGHYSSPRAIVDYYSKVELGYPSSAEESIMEYAEDSDIPLKTVYGYVPVHIVDKILIAHGGISFYKWNDEEKNV